MQNESYQASAPGSLMLFGEHAVLHGKQALVSAIDKRMTVTLTPRSDKIITITSARLGNFSVPLAELTIERPFQFVLATLKYYQHRMKSGCDLVIESDFSDQVGFGSSAAVTVATVAVILSWLSRKFDLAYLLREARTIVRQVQGLGSGADVAASVYGGVVVYRAQPLQVEKIDVVHPLTVVYSGAKTPTPEVVQHVQTKFASYPQVFQQLCNSIGSCAVEAMQLLRAKSFSAVGEMMNVQQSLMDALGVNTQKLHHIVETLNQTPGISGAKISGSGMGDCVVGWGEFSDLAPTFQYENIEVLPVTMSLKGVEVA